MKYAVFLLLLSAWFVIEITKADYEHDRAYIGFINKQYMSKASILTRRKGRNSPYYTNATVTFLYPTGNNVSVIIEIANLKISFDVWRLEYKLCDTFKIIWTSEWLKRNTDITNCPIPPGTYHSTQLELPPRNLPFQMSNSDFHCKLILISTKTRDRLLEFIIDLKYVQKRKIKN